MHQVSDLISPRRQQLERVKAKIQGDVDLFRGAPPSREVREGLLRRRVIEVMCDEGIVCTGRELREIVSALVEEMLGLGSLEPLLRDDRITEIMVNGPGQAFVEIGGKIREIGLDFHREDQVFHLIDRIVAPLGLRVDESSPYVDARLEDGSRVNVIVPPLSLKGPVITIRKFSRTPISLEMMVEAGELSSELAGFLSRSVERRLNILISGGTGSGKTTLLNALSYHIPAGERIITIEDAAELRLQQPHVIPLEARPPNLEGKGEVTVRDLLRNALRMRPDRIIVGEVRGGEALDMLQAMNTGHEGSLSTIHANSPGESLLRLETMVAMANAGLHHSAIAAQIALSVDLIVHLARGADGIRRIVEVSSLGKPSPEKPYSLETLFRLDPPIRGKRARVLPLVDDSRLEEVLGRRFWGNMNSVEGES